METDFKNFRNFLKTEFDLADLYLVTEIVRDDQWIPICGGRRCGDGVPILWVMWKWPFSHLVKWNLVLWKYLFRNFPGRKTCNLSILKNCWFNIEATLVLTFRLASTGQKHRFFSTGTGLFSNTWKTSWCQKESTKKKSNKFKKVQRRTCDCHLYRFVSLLFKTTNWFVNSRITFCEKQKNRFPTIDFMLLHAWVFFRNLKSWTAFRF